MAGAVRNLNQELFNAIDWSAYTERSCEARVRKLINEGAKATEIFREGMTALHLAARWDMHEVVQIILEMKVGDPNQRRGVPTTPYCLAIKGSTALHEALYHHPHLPPFNHINCKHLKTLRILLEAGANPRIANNRGRTPEMIVRDAMCQDLRALWDEVVPKEVPSLQRLSASAIQFSQQDRAAMKKFPTVRRLVESLRN